MATSSKATHNPQLMHYGLMMFGQLLSLFGTHLVTFSFAVWVYSLNGSVVEMALLSVCAILPTVLISPVAGVIADRAPKKRTLILVDSFLGLISLIVLGLSFSGLLQPWHLYISALCGGFAAGLQRPLFESITPLMVPEDKLVNVNGVVQTVAGISQLLSPALAGALVLTVGLNAVIAIDLITFTVAMLTLVYVSIPVISNVREAGVSWAEDLKSGFSYVFDRAGLRAMFLLVTARNFAFAVCEVLALPLLLTLTTADTAGLILSLSGLGIVVGGATMAVTGGFKRKINSVFFAQLLTAAGMILAAVTTNLWLLGFAVALAFVAFPVEESTSTTIMQTGVPKKMMGRVSAVRQMLTLSAVPVAMLISAPMAEYVFEPWINEGEGSLLELARSVVGQGDGRGMAVMLILMGITLIVVTLVGWAYKPLVNVEATLAVDTEELSEGEAKESLPGSPENPHSSAAAKSPAVPLRSSTSTSAPLHSKTQSGNRIMRYLSERPYLISIALMALVIAWMFVPVAEEEASAEDTTETTAQELQKVQITTLQAQSLIIEQEFTGQTKADQSANISAELDGLLVELHADRGSRVEKGDVLVTLSSGSLAAGLLSAQAEEARARSEYNAQKSLSAQGIASKRAMADAFAALQAARALVGQYSTEKEKAKIYAPFSGIVADHFAEIGDFLGMGQPILSLINIDQIVAVGDVSERQIGNLKVGEQASISILGKQKIHGTISYISTVANTATRTFQVEVSVPNDDLSIAVGMTTKVSVPMEDIQAYKISPSLFTLNAKGEVQLATVDDENIVRLSSIEIVRNDADGVWITGIPNQARLITLGQGFVREGEEVIPNEAGESLETTPDEANTLSQAL